MRVVKHFTEAMRPCSYLGDRSAQLEYRVLLEVTPFELEAMLARGWRRFGPTYFRPACRWCDECVSLRLPVSHFAPTESQRRALRRARRFRLEWGPPRVDRARLRLYERWHQMREQTRGWDDSPIDERAYFYQFAFPHPSARELAFYDGDEVVAVGIYDETPNALSAVYFFYAPEIARLSPGVANVMLAVERAKDQHHSHVYLGYRVAGCRSLEYKGRFKPHQLLVGRPSMDEEPRWVDA